MSWGLPCRPAVYHSRHLWRYQPAGLKEYEAQHEQGTCGETREAVGSR